jgi:hypothetical protein
MTQRRLAEGVEDTAEDQALAAEEEARRGAEGEDAVIGPARRGSRG